MPSPLFRRRLAPLVALPLLLTACGGDGSDQVAAGPNPPAGQSAAPDPHAGHGGMSPGAGAMSPGHDHSSHSHGTVEDSGIGTLLETDDGHGHTLREAPAGERPTLTLEVLPDPMGGWNVRLQTTEFVWSPEDVNTSADAGTGHAHLYVDGTKVARPYGEWTYLPESAGRAGQTLDAVLYADDHTAWAVDGKAVEASVPLPGAAA